MSPSRRDGIHSMTHTTLFQRTLLLILVPRFNKRAYPRRCVERVPATPLPEIVEREIIIVDGAPTDGTHEIIADVAAEHPGVICAFRPDPNQGEGAAIRRAIEEKGRVFDCHYALGDRVGIEGEIAARIAERVRRVRGADQPPGPRRHRGQGHRVEGGPSAI